MSKKVSFLPWQGAIKLRIENYKFVQVPTRKQSSLAVKEKQPFGRCNLPSGLLYENNMYIRAISRDTMEVLSFAKA